MAVTKIIEINEREYTLELSAPYGAHQNIYEDPLILTYDVHIDHFWLGRIKRKNGFWYPVDSFGTRPKNPVGLERALLIFEAADFQAMGEMIEGES